jgi:hypothetical protein
MDIGPKESAEKGLTRNVNNPVDPEDKLFMEDRHIMEIINRRKTAAAFKLFIKDIQGILQ